MPEAGSADCATAARAAAPGGPRRRRRRRRRVYVHRADPAAGIRASPGEAEPVIMPLTAAAIDDVTAAATTPAARLALILAAVHAARPAAIRTLTIADVDLPTCG
jgi:integrase